MNEIKIINTDDMDKLDKEFNKYLNKINITQHEQMLLNNINMIKWDKEREDRRIKSIKAGE